MKKILLITVCALFGQLAFGQSLKDFKWLEGTWERQNARPGTTAFEVWEKDKKSYLGQGVSMQGSDTTFVEKLNILKKDGDWYYVANVASNGEPTYFRITSLTENSFVSENPAHDFPKKITYTLEGDKLTAVISAGEKAMGFVFLRAD